MVNLVPPAAIILLDVLSVDLLATVVAANFFIHQTTAHAYLVQSKAAAHAVPILCARTAQLILL